MTRYNRPGAPANPPQHSLDERPLPRGGDVDTSPPRHKAEPAARGRDDLADPHPSDEEHPYRARNEPALGLDPKGRAGRPVEHRDIGPNPHVHDGTPKPRPRNAETSR